MPAKTMRPPAAAEKQAAPTPPFDQELDRLISDPQVVAQANRATAVRQLTGWRRLVDPTTCERDYAAAELEFMRAMQEYKQRSGRMFPTWSEVLEVLQDLGYEKAADTANEPARRPTTAGGVS